MTSRRHWIRGDGEPVCQQVCAAEYYSCETILNKLGKYFQKEVSNSPKSRGARWRMKTQGVNSLQLT